MIYEIEFFVDGKEVHRTDIYDNLEAAIKEVQFERDFIVQQIRDSGGEELYETEYGKNLGERYDSWMSQIAATKNGMFIEDYEVSVSARGIKVKSQFTENI